MTKQQDWQHALQHQNWQQAIDMATLNVAETLHPQYVINRLCVIAKAAQNYQQTDVAIQCYKQAIILFNQIDGISTDAKPPGNHVLKETVLEFLIDLHVDQNQFSQAKNYFSQTLQARHQRVMAPISQQKAVVFSLFGSNPFYCETAILIADMFEQFYNGWTYVIYYDNSVPEHVTQRLAKYAFVELTNVSHTNAQQYPGTFWRFLALEDDRWQTIVFRDIDSLPTDREIVLVNDWLASDKPFHVIHDWFSHSDLMLAGLWGARGGLLQNIRQLIDQYIKENQTLHPTHADQYFLAEKIWPKIAPFTLHHSWLGHAFNAQWPTVLPEKDENTASLGAFFYTNYSLPSKGNYLVKITKNEQLICQYFLQNQENFEMPRIYRHRIDSGEYQMVITAYNFNVTVS